MSRSQTTSPGPGINLAQGSRFLTGAFLSDADYQAHLP
jgi:hypothetical protein